MSESLQFGRFELQPRERRLLADGEPVAIGARAFDLLLALAERPHRLVDKNTLLDLVWPGLVVQENNLPSQISALRKALGEGVIVTIPGRGYRFVAPVQRLGAEAAPPAMPEPPAARVGGPPPGRQRTNLPAVLPELIGRAAELASLQAQVAVNRLVCVVGAGGMGKSLLVQHLLQQSQSDHAQGVCWVELDVASAETLAGTVGAALGVAAGASEPLTALQRTLAPLELLLALDSAERLLDEVARLCIALLEAAPGLRVVVTSQAPLRLPTEVVHRLPPLAVPREPSSVDEALQHGAVQLFVRRARALDSRFAIAPSQAAAVSALCRALDGVPLAIELAAARAPTLGVPALLSGMQDRLDLLTRSGNRFAPPRQQSLRAALEWSHACLGPVQRTVFRRLGVIAGSASLELVLRVVSDDDEGGSLDRWAALDALDGLIDWSLVTVRGGSAAEAPRYRLLESPRAFALEGLDADEATRLERRHAQAVAACLDAAYERYYDRSGGVDAWMLEMAADLDNARKALAWARAQAEAGTELVVASTLLRAMPPPLLRERIALAEACLSLLESPSSQALPLNLRVRAWVETSCALSSGQRERSRQAAATATQLLDRHHGAAVEPFLRYHAWCQLACASAMTGRIDEAEQALGQALAMEDRSWSAERLIWGAEAALFVAHGRDDDAQALAQARRTVELDRERGKDASIALANLVYVEVHAGNAQQAVRLGLEIVESLRGSRHEHTLALARLNLLSALVTVDDAARAREVATALWAQMLQFDWAYYVLGYLAQLAMLEGRPRAAALLIGRSEALTAARPQERPAPARLAAEARAKDAARAALGAPAFAQAVATGAELPLATLREVALGMSDA